MHHGRATLRRLRVIAFSEPQLNLASIPKDSSSRESVIVTNVSKVPGPES
jgi:hypothetical protein